MARKNTQKTRTINHEEIEQWARERGGRPAADTRSGGMLKIDFGEKGDGLVQMSWPEFFSIFDESDLAFVYEDITGDGEVSYEYAFVPRGPEDEIEEADVFEDDAM